MSRFSKLSHVIWHCQYHIVWVPKYRYRVLKDKVGYEVMKTVRVYAERQGYGSGQREGGDSGVQAVSLFEKEALLG